MRVDGLDKLAAIARPSCRKCKHPLTVDRVSPGARGFQELSFKCSTCGHIEKLATPVDPVRTDAAGWLASELIPPK
jgi:RNase P subunit RPR2